MDIQDEGQNSVQTYDTYRSELEAQGSEPQAENRLTHNRVRKRPAQKR